LGVAKPPAHHIEWLGAPDLTENGVRDALSRLTVPRTANLRTPLLVLRAAGGRGRRARSRLAARINFPPPREATAAARHDIALLSLAVLLRLDPALQLADEWRRTYALWKELIEGKNSGRC
jgi:hypothetical protein